jgi:hypothetical protein
VRMSWSHCLDLMNLSLSWKSFTWQVAGELGMIEDATWFRTQRSLLERASDILDSYLTSWKELLDVERILIVLFFSMACRWWCTVTLRRCEAHCSKGRSPVKRFRLRFYMIWPRFSFSDAQFKLGTKAALLLMLFAATNQMWIFLFFWPTSNDIRWLNGWMEPLKGAFRSCACNSKVRQLPRNPCCVLHSWALTHSGSPWQPHREMFVEWLDHKESSQSNGLRMGSSRWEEGNEGTRSYPFFICGWDMEKTCSWKDTICDLWGCHCIPFSAAKCPGSTALLIPFN